MQFRIELLTLTIFIWNKIVKITQNAQLCHIHIIVLKLDIHNLLLREILFSPPRDV